MFKKTATEIILDALQNSTEASANLIYIMMASRPESYRRAKKLLRGEKLVEIEGRWSDSYREKKNFYNLINKLKNQGLVKNKKVKKESVWSITRKGLSHLSKQKSKFPIITKDLKPQETGVIIVSYDIPEIFKKERAWVRDSLRILDFEMVHKSVWLGKVSIPEELVDLLKKKDILQYIHIFSISKSGTLVKI